MNSILLTLTNSRNVETYHRAKEGKKNYTKVYVSYKLQRISCGHLELYISPIGQGSKNISSIVKKTEQTKKILQNN